MESRDTMLLEHQRKHPHIYEAAYIAPTATVCGDVTSGRNRSAWP